MRTNIVTKPDISFEFFPPKTEKSAQALWEAVPKLAALNPKLMTVTYGAGGTTRDGTIEAVERMMAETGLPVASHYTFLNTTKDEIRDYIGQLWEKDIRHIVALRGDMPDDLSWPLDPDAAYFQTTSDFISGLKLWYEFDIMVGCYPETHPDAVSPEKDIEALKRKCDAGADRAFTQFFFDNDVYYDFVERCRAAGIETPICPGLVPVHDFKNLVSFAKRCQACIPQWLHEKFEGLDDKPEEAYKVAVDIMTTQVQDLAANGVEHIHFYTLNKAGITVEACEALGYEAAKAA